MVFFYFTCSVNWPVQTLYYFYDNKSTNNLWMKYLSIIRSLKTQYKAENIRGDLEYMRSTQEWAKSIRKYISK